MGAQQSFIARVNRDGVARFCIRLAGGSANGLYVTAGGVTTEARKALLWARGPDASGAACTVYGYRLLHANRPADVCAAYGAINGTPCEPRGAGWVFFTETATSERLSWIRSRLAMMDKE